MNLPNSRNRHDTSNQNRYSKICAKLSLFTEWFQSRNEFKQNLKATELLYWTFNYLPKAKIMVWNNLFDFIWGITHFAFGE